jgi:hypothetical protein
MKKILPLLVIATRLAAIPSAIAVYTGDCTWDDHNSTDTIYTYARVIGCGSGGDGGSTAGGGLIDPPFIKCIWQYDMDIQMADGWCDPCETIWYEGKHDACPCVDDLQVKPDLGDYVTVRYYAIIADPYRVFEPVDDVWVDVYHPCGDFKYQVHLEPVGFESDGSYSNSEALSAWSHVLSYHPSLITYGDWDTGEMTKDEDIEYELVKWMAYLYCGEADISYCQPGGEYALEYQARTENSWSAILEDSFWYIPTAAIDIDFSEVDYGDIKISEWQQAPGDEIWDSPTPTVRNIGNCPVYLSIWQDNMMFLQDYEGNWKVEYKAKMGPFGEYTPIYGPYEETTIPGILSMCTWTQLDFAIHAIKGLPGEIYSGDMVLTAHIYGDPPCWEEGS